MIEITGKVVGMGYMPKTTIAKMQRGGAAKEGGLAVSCSGLVLLDEASEEQLRNFLILRQKSNTR